MRALENYYAHTTFKRWPVFNCARLRMLLGTSQQFAAIKGNSIPLSILEVARSNKTGPETVPPRRAKQF